MTDKYSYDAYGAVLAHQRGTGSVDQPYQYVGQLGYYTHWQRPGLGLLQLRLRFYDPRVGRYTQHGSPYIFAANNPLASRMLASGKSCYQMRKDIKGIGNEVESHGRKEDKAGCKGALHPKPCKNLLNTIQDYLSAGCESNGDTAHPITDFCKGICAFYKRCKGRSWPYQAPLNDKDLDPYYDRCGCGN